jgi:carbonic anhydrase
MAYRALFGKQEPDVPMTSDLSPVLRRNREWARAIQRQNPSFFKNMAKGQKPPILWIGCSDSRVPPTSVMQLKPGDVFVHRNIGIFF